MTLNDLKGLVTTQIARLREFGEFPKENDHYDYKRQLNIPDGVDDLEAFLRNFAKDIISFSNGEGGVILMGINEDRASGLLTAIGLSDADLNLLAAIDLSKVNDKLVKLTGAGVQVDLQSFIMGSGKYYYMLIEKQHSILVPKSSSVDYNLVKGEIIYRLPGKNEIANLSTNDFNRFLQKKASEKNKEFMEIWSKLMPEIFDINPREILLINPKINKVYGFNGRDNVLASSDIEIDKGNGGVFNIILQAISAGDIGKISNDEGKPLYKIVGEINTGVTRAFIQLTTLETDLKKNTVYKFTNSQLKQAIKYLGWVNDSGFKVVDPSDGTVIEASNQFIWVEELDKHRKVVFSQDATKHLLEVVNNDALHEVIFGKKLVKVK